MVYRIELNNVSFAYEGAQELFRGLSLSVQAPEVLAIKADVGSGKSTLLKLVAGLLRPTSGEVTIGGLKFWNLTNAKQDDIRRQMGFDFQEGALIANMSIFDNLALPLRYYRTAGEKEISALVDSWLERLSLSSCRNLLPAALSAGLRRKVSFARAVMQERRFYFWDEPFEGAGDELKGLVADTIIAAKKAGAGHVIATKDESLIRSVADREFEIEGHATNHQ